MPQSGTEIIAELCAHSSTFETKTEFSQDKYKRKKVVTLSWFKNPGKPSRLIILSPLRQPPSLLFQARKYLVYVTVRRPTARALCESYYVRGPERVFNLRVDSLAAMLSLANVGAGGKV